MSADNQQERLQKIGWIIGFVDGEGCFSVSVFRNKTSKLGWQTFPEFAVTQGEKSLQALETLKNHFQCGKITVNRRKDNHKENLYRYTVRNINDLRRIIIPFFKLNFSIVSSNPAISLSLLVYLSYLRFFCQCHFASKALFHRPFGALFTKTHARDQRYRARGY